MTTTPTLPQLLGQRLLVGFEGLTAPEYVLQWLAEGRVGGVILFARNVEAPEQVARLTESIHRAGASAVLPPLISIDQEGGTVARLRAMYGFTESPGAFALAAGEGTLEEKAARTEAVYAVLGREMAALGIHWAYAPSLDLLLNADNPTLGTRTFGRDPAIVSALGAAAVRGLQSAGVAACAKHFPGLGDTATDTHMALPTLYTSEATLLERDIAPYRAAMEAGVASVMTTHTIVAALDDQHPITLSPVVVRRLLREQLGFGGVVTTDCLEMRAIKDNYGAGGSPLAHAAVLGALAGVDVLLFSHTRAVQEEAMAALANAAASGRLPLAELEESYARIAAMKGAFPAHQIDSSEIFSVAHVAVMDEAAQKAVTLLYGTPPDLSGDGVVVEFASYLESGVVEAGGETGLAQEVSALLPNARTFSLRSADEQPEHVERAFAAAAGADWLIVATRNACWNAEQAELAESLLKQNPRAVLLCLRTPFDADQLPRVQAAYCTFGDSAPSVRAIVAALAGAFVPAVSNPVAEIIPV